MGEEQNRTQQELAEVRTRSAHERTLLAQERTYSAWVRTGLASVATGFAIVKLMPGLEPRWAVVAMGGLFVSAGIVLFALAYRTYRKGVKSTPGSRVYGLPLWVLTLVSAALLIAAVMALVLLFVE